MIVFFHDLFFSRSREVLGFLGSLQIITLPALGMLAQSSMIVLWPHLAKQKGVPKFILVPMVLESGGFGGVFAPTLFLGSMLGFLFAFAVNLASTYTGITVSATTFILVGMGAVLAAVNSIPMAALMILFERKRRLHSLAKRSPI